MIDQFFGFKNKLNKRTNNFKFLKPSINLIKLRDSYAVYPAEYNTVEFLEETDLNPRYSRYILNPRYSR